ncbi:hypothetical protein FACS1894219_11910 [Clostridia bacterium]|nr:hypothetical protein FACS1894219_11910 [Clostridia bacterium]
MLTTKFGIEIEFTGITRTTAANTVAKSLGGVRRHIGGSYDTHEITAPDGRIWKIVSDGSIACQRKEHGVIISADRDYSVELVSPILTYREDIDTLQELVRELRHAGGFANLGCGIHIHLDGADHTPRSIRNFVNIIASKNDLLYDALQVAPERMAYCKKIDAALVEKMNRKKPKTFKEIADIWYDGFTGNRDNHYHQSRYAFCNLHSLFTGTHTVELRGFNSELHAGKIRSCIILALALNHQALTLKNASARKVQTANKKFAMRTFLNRIGFIGEEFKNCREHLTAHLSGNAAWRFRAA